MSQPRFISILGAERDSATGDSIFRFQGDDGMPYSARLAEGLLNALYSVVVTHLQAGEAAKSLAVQLATLTGFRQAIHENGTPILELHLDGTPLAVAVPRNALPSLRSALSELETLTETRTPSGPRH